MLALSLVLAGLPLAPAQTASSPFEDVEILEETKFTDPEGEAGDRFGINIDTTGDRLVVGARAIDDPVENAGKAFVYERDGTGWERQQTLAAPDPVVNAEFGETVRLADDRLAIAAPGDDDQGNQSGSVYVFADTASGYELEAKLVGSTVGEGDKFGSWLEHETGTLIVGAPLHDGDGHNSGAAYVFERSGTSWTETAALAPEDASADTWFGSSVAITGDTILVGAAFADVDVRDQGAVYVFERSGENWTQSQQLTASDAMRGDQLGTWVATAGGTAIVGAPAVDHQARDAGTAYVFEAMNGTWQEQQELVPPEPNENAQFGYYTDAVEGTLLVGSPFHDENETNEGETYLYTRENGAFALERKLSASDAQDDDRFGRALVLADDTIAIGSPHEDTQGDSAGAVYTFGPDADDDGLSTGQEDELGTRPATTDTDSDGLLDGPEVLDHSTDPLVPDTDDDGLSDGDEVRQHSTEPRQPDTDEDGLADGAEVDNGTDPLVPDTDADGLEDGAELEEHATDPTRADTDGDGLLDGPELDDHGTDPLVADTDTDGLGDGEEVHEQGTDALDPDTDDDRLGDGPEVYAHSTDPLATDTDEDGLTDGAEVLDWRTQPLDPDTDGDLFADAREVDNGSNPRDPASVPSPLGPTPGTEITRGEEVPVLDELTPLAGILEE